MTDQQLPLDFDPRKLRRRTDPKTSDAAASSAKELRAKHHKIIIGALRESGDMTSEQISDIVSLDYWAVARRMRELCDANLIVETGQVRRNRSGRQATVWRVV